MTKPKVLVTVPQPMRGTLVRPEAWTQLQLLAEVVTNEDGRNWTAEDLAVRLPGVDAMVTGWGIVKLTDEVLRGADRLRLIAHSAGSVKGFITDAVYERGIAVSHAASRIADSVAEFTLLLALMGLRRAHELDLQMKSGVAWPSCRDWPIYEIAGRKVGLLGMGYVGRRVARLFRAVGAEVWVYDPYFSAERALELGVEQTDLHTLLQTCPVISIHLPVTPETHHLLGAAELALIQEGAVVVNTARSWVVDQDALLAELSRKRFWAALDVYDQEPLPADHPFRRLDNVLLTPHVAGFSRDAYSGLITLMIDEMERFFSGKPLRYPVTRDMLATMA